MKRTRTDNKNGQRKVIRIILSPIVIACLLIAAGIALIAFPLNIIGTLLRVIGAVILAVEIFRIIPIFSSDDLASRLLIFIFTDMLALIAALILLINPIGAINLIYLIFGVYLIVTAGITLFRRVTAGVRKRAYIMPLVTLALGIALVFFPTDVTRVTMIVLGCIVLFKGADMLLGELIRRKNAPKRNAKDPLIDTEYRDISDNNHG